MEKAAPFAQPSNGPAIFAALRDVLAELYAEESTARVVVDDAGLDAKQIAFSSRAQTNWHNILAAAIRQARLDSLLKIALADYSVNPALLAAYGQYRFLIDQGSSLEAPDPLPADAGVTIAGDVNLERGDFIGNNKIVYGDEIHGNQYVVSTLDDVPLLVEKLREELNRYRKQVEMQTRYVKLEGIPSISDEDLTGRIPLQRVYIHIQALEQRQSQKLQRAEEQTLHDKAANGQMGQHQPDLFDRIGRRSEYLYRHSEGVENNYRPVPVDLLEALRKHRHLVLLGAPGAGKSTLLRYIAHQTAVGGEGKLALLVPLGEFALTYRQDRKLVLSEWAFSYAASHNNELRQALHHSAKTGAVLWLFDGLDETGDLREETSRQISQMSIEAQVVVTSRPVGYRRTYLEQFEHFEMLPLTTANVEQFIKDWLTILSDQQGYSPEWIKECSDWLQRQLATRPHLRALTQSPLLLTFLVVLARHNPRKNLPERRSDLYNLYLDELFNRERRKQSAIVTPSRKSYIQGIYAIAWYLHLADFDCTQNGKATKGKHSVIYLPTRPNVQQYLVLVLQQKSTIARTMDVEDLADQIIDFWIRSGLIEEWESQQSKFITFRHFTFQEYGAAQVLHSAWQMDAVRAWRFLKPRLHHPDWREPLLLLAEQMQEFEIDCLLRHLLRHPSPYDYTLQRDLDLAVTLVRRRERTSTQIIQQISRRLYWHLRVPHILLMLLIWLLLRVLIFIAGCTVAWFLYMPPWLTGLIGLITLAVSIFVDKRNLTIHAFLTLPLRPWLMNVRVRADAAIALGRLGDRRAVEPLLIALKDVDPDIRGDVASALGMLGDERSVEPLLVALKDQKLFVRLSVIMALARLGDKRALEPLIVILKDNDSRIRRLAVSALSQLEDEQSVEALLAALSDHDDSVRKIAAEALGKLGNAGLKGLFVALSREDVKARRSAAHALLQLRDERAVKLILTDLKNESFHSSWVANGFLDTLRDVDIDSLLATFKDESYLRHRSAIQALVQRGDRQAVESLLTALKDEDVFVCWTAAYALDQLTDKQVIEPLLAALKDDDSFVRWWAARVLDNLESVDVELLLGVLKDKDEFVRWAVAEKLCELEEGRIIESLIPILNDDDVFVRWTAAYALGKLGDRRAMKLLLDAIKDDNDYVRRRAVEALGKLRDERAIEPLLVALNDKDASVRQIAAHALGESGDGRAVEPLSAALKDVGANVRWRAAYALGKLGDGRAVEPLLIFLKQNEDTCWAAIDALGELGDKRAMKPLLAALNDEDDFVRRRAAEALSQIRDIDIESLFTALKDNDNAVRWGAAKALGQLQSVKVESLLIGLKDKDADIRWGATYALGLRREERAVEPLLVALKDKDSAVRWWAAWALKELSVRYATNWEYGRIKKIASALWWRITDDSFWSGNESAFGALSAVVNRFHIPVTIDDLLLPTKDIPRFGINSGEGYE